MKRGRSKMMRDAAELQKKDRAKKLIRVNSLINHANLSHNTGQAIEKYQKAINLGEEIGEKSLVAKAYLGLGVGYQAKRNFSEAKNSFEKSKEIYQGLDQQKHAKNIQSKLARLAEESGSLGNRILQKVGFATAIIGFLGSVFFMTNSFTGYAIVEINQQSSSLFGVVLFLIGIVGLYFWTSR